MDLQDKGKMSGDMIRYIPGLTKVAYQGQIDLTETKRKYVDDTCKNKKVLNSIYFLQQIIIQIFKICTSAFHLNLKWLMIMIAICSQNSTCL